MRKLVMLGSAYSAKAGVILGAALLFAATAQAEVELRISDELSTILALSNQDRISMRGAGTITVDGDVVLRIVADMPEPGRNDVTSTPAAAIGNTQLDCDVDTLPGQQSTRVFTCDPRPVSLGLQNRVCVGYEEAFQFGPQEDLTVYADNRCIDFFGL